MLVGPGLEELAEHDGRKWGLGRLTCIRKKVNRDLIVVVQKSHVGDSLLLFN